ncbi:MAG: acetylxylan esterase, partial [Bacteroidetes bacterium]|nr:acetylxylan esterase [Bacteroidota bacterium]
MKYSVLVLLFFVSMVINAQNNTNYDESKIPEYKLPDPLLMLDGGKVTDANMWMKNRRPEILHLFEEQVYGRIPGKLDISSFQVVEENSSALDNQAIRKQVKLKFNNNNKELEFHILIYLPKDVKNAPVFLAYNFYGNHSIVNDKDVLITKAWVRNNEQFGINDNKATEQSRGTRTNRWAIEKIISSGYGLATIYYGEVDPDNNDFSDGVHPLLYSDNQTQPKDNEWGSISAWAWGLTKAMDYFEKDNDIDNSRVIVMGHSRLGKT